MTRIAMPCILVALQLVFPARAASEGEVQRIFASATPDHSNALSGIALVKALRGGGHTLYIRHASFNDEVPDTGITKPDSCDALGILTPKGREEAAAISAGLKRIAVPVAEVYASPFCRTMDTARALSVSVISESRVRGEQNNFAWVGDLMRLPPPAGKNRVIVGHISAPSLLMGDQSLVMGETVVIRAEGKASVVVARIRAGDWAALPDAP